MNKSIHQSLNVAFETSLTQVYFEISFDEHVVSSLWVIKVTCDVEGLLCSVFEIIYHLQQYHFPSPANRGGHWNPIIWCPTEMWLPGEVRWDWCGDEGLHGLPMDLLEHEQDLWTLGNQLTLAAGVKLFKQSTKNSLHTTHVTKV